MPSTVAVAHYPEGAGHATRMLAIANALEARGAEVLMAGGGAGSEFVSLNGYDAFEPRTVDYIDTYQGGSLGKVLTQSVPASAGRTRDYLGWLRETEPDALVTDDMFAAMAASRTDVPLYALKHDVPGLYRDPIERSGARFHTKFQLATSREFFYPAIWPSSDVDPGGARRIPPVALEGDVAAIDAADVVVVPSYFSDLDPVADRLRRRGYDVINVADDDWDPVPSLLPYIRGADAVVCSGYSTIMDAAVAGTPCIIDPATDEQEAVADWIDRSDTTGFTIAEGPLDVLDAVESPPATPDFDNGADTVAERVLDDLGDDAPVAAARESERSTVAGSTPSSTGAAPSAATSSSRASAATSADGGSPAVASTRGVASDSPSTTREFASAAASRLVGSARSAATSTAAGSVLAGVVGHQVAAHGLYWTIQRSLPTYSGGVSELFLFATVALVALAALSAAFDAGVVPSVLLASGPVVGWAANHWLTAMPVPHYSITFLFEMALLYGGAFGVVGYLLGSRLRWLAPTRRSTPAAK